MFLCKQECELSTDVESSNSVRGGWRPYQDKFVNFFKFSWSGKFYICQGKVREFQNPVAVATMLM